MCFFLSGTTVLEVPEDSLEAIFQPFYRINGKGKATGGNGLGLAIASEAFACTAVRSAPKTSSLRASKLLCSCLPPRNRR